MKCVACLVSLSPCARRFASVRAPGPLCFLWRLFVTFFSFFPLLVDPPRQRESELGKTTRQLHRGEDMSLQFSLNRFPQNGLHLIL